MTRITARTATIETFQKVAKTWARGTELTRMNPTPNHRWVEPVSVASLPARTGIYGGNTEEVDHPEFTGDAPGKRRSPVWLR